MENNNPLGITGGDLRLHGMELDFEGATYYQIPLKNTGMLSYPSAAFDMHQV